VTNPLDPIEGSRTDFYFKFLPAPDGKASTANRRLIYCHRDETSQSVESRRLEVILRESALRPRRRFARTQAA